MINANPSDEPGSDEAVLSANALKALRALARIAPSPIGELSKNSLAIEVFGRDTNSTRSMTSRVSAMLIRSGLASERRDGRERYLKITVSGQRELTRHPQPFNPQTVGKTPQIPTLQDALRSENVHDDDRPRFHLRHAALLALWKLRHLRKRITGDDWNFESMLLSLAYEVGDEQEDLRRDRELFAALAPEWSARDKRRRLIDCLVRFQDVELRRDTGADLVALGEHIESEPDAILWSSAAIDLAHHYSFAPASQTDRMTARRLLDRAKELLETVVRDAELQVAANYRLGKVAKVAGIGWTNQNTKRPPVLDVKDDSDLCSLGEALNRTNEQVYSAARFNNVLEGLDRVLARYLGRWIMLAMPSSEWVFRRGGGIGIAEAIREWAEEMKERGVLNDLLISQVKEHSVLKDHLKRFIEAAEDKFVTSGFEPVIEPHVAQARALLYGDATGKPVAYDAMLMNNLWNPEMVAAHIIALPPQ